MSYINIDSRGCGAGKTYTSIIPQIKQNIISDIKTLLVVGSKALQHQYAEDLGFISDFVIINGDTNTDSVNEQLTTATATVVCITHQGFLISNHRDTYNTALIIDEAFDPYDSVTFNTNTADGDNIVDLKSMVEWKTPEVVPDERPTESPQPFYELTFSSSSLPDSVSNSIKSLQSTNKRLWCTWETYNNLKNNSPETTTLYTEYDAYKLLGGWASVWIAAAVFEKTFMGAWLDMSALADVEVRHEFEKHNGACLTVHRPKQKLSLSKTFLSRDNGKVVEQFQSHISANRKGKMYSIVNKKSAIAFLNATSVPYNAHGINKYKEYTEFVNAIAVKPNSNYKSFIKQRTDMNDRQLEFAFAGYTAYQLLMRSRLRVAGNTSIVNTYFLDTRQAEGVCELFENNYITKYIDITVDRKVAMTGAERAARARAKRRANK